MNSLLMLRSDDFHLDNAQKGPILCTGIKGLSLVMFYSPMCPISTKLLPAFKHLPQIISGCKFCILNINENQQIIALSKETIAPIDFVPYIIFYVNGRPFLQYDDDATLEKLAAFVQYAMKLVEGKKSFIDKGAKMESDIPKYSIAMPYTDFKVKCEGDFCYLTQAQAYGTSTSKTPGVLDQSPPQYFQRS